MEINATQFEKLLLEFCKQDLPPGFKVVHDYKQIGIESENKRQIDVRITGNIGISEILICGEAKNWNEVVGAEVIDALVGKYLSGEIKANKVILFSNMGFTAPAVTRAKKLGIELLQPHFPGKPIIKVPHIVAVGYLNQMLIEIVYDGVQHNAMAIDINDYVIKKGSDPITFQQMVFKNVISSLRRLPKLHIRIEVGKLTINESNVLYELKSVPHHRFNGHFKVEVDFKWDFFVEDIEDAILFHLNKENILHVRMENHRSSIMEKVLMSPTKRNYESRSECIIKEVEHSVANEFIIAMVDPDQHKIDPHRPTFSII